MSQEVCAKCNSDKIIPNVTILDSGDGGDDLSAIFDENPKALLNKKRTFHKLSAKICGNCGYTEIYAADFDKLFSAYEKSITK